MTFRPEITTGAAMLLTVLPLRTAARPAALTVQPPEMQLFANGATQQLLVSARDSKGGRVRCFSQCSVREYTP